MSINITLDNVAYPVPSSAADTNWAADQVAFEQALAAAINDAVRVLNVNTTSVGNVGSGEDNLITYTLPAATLHTNAQGLRVTAWGITANNADAKTVKLYFGATQVAAISLTTSQANTWRFEAVIVRTGASSQVGSASFIQGGTVSQVGATGSTPVGTLSSNVIVKCTGEATTIDDIIQRGLLVELLP